MNQVLNFEPAFAAFMAKAQAQVATRYQAQGYGNAAPVLTFMEGNRYVRLVKTSYGQRSAFGFVDKQNGNVLKAAGWKAPAKNFARGNIFDPQNGTGRVEWTGVY